MQSGIDLNHTLTSRKSQAEDTFEGLVRKCGLDAALVTALSKHGYVSIESLIRLKGTAQIKALLRNLMVDVGSGEQRALTQAEKDQVLDLHRRCLSEAGLPETFGNSFFLGSNREIEQVQLESEDPPLNRVGEMCGLQPHLLDMLYALDIMNASALAKLCAGFEFQSVVLCVRRDFGDGRGERRLDESETDQLKCLYEACRQIRGLPTGLYMAPPSLRSSMLEKSQKSEELAQNLAKTVVLPRKDLRARRDITSQVYFVKKPNIVQSPLKSQTQPGRPPGVYFWPLGSTEDSPDREGPFGSFPGRRW